MDWIYLDNNATTRPDDAVVEAMTPFLTERYANPSSVHAFGGQVRAAVEQARERLARLLGCRPAHLVFTSGGTESDNLAVRGVLAARAPRNHLVLSAVEHSAVSDLAESLEQTAVQVTRVPVDGSGRLDLDRLADAIDADRTAVVAVMHANNETGVIFPVPQVAELCRQRGVPLLCDAVQSFGKIAVNVEQLGADLVSLSAHKFHGPKGAGALFVRRGTPLAPWLVGHHERRRRGGTENVAGIIGLAEAAERAVDRLDEKSAAIAALRDRLERGLLDRVPDAKVNGGRPRLCNTSNISFPGCRGEALLIALSEQGIAVSTGAACSSGSPEPSHVLRAMGLPPPMIEGAIRFSLSHHTTAEQIDRVLSALPPLVERLRGLNR